jgi:lysophospholipase L1-like esterase
VSRKNYTEAALPVYGLLLFISVIGLTGASGRAEAVQEQENFFTPTATQSHPAVYDSDLEVSSLEVSFHDRLHLPFVFNRSKVEGLVPTPTSTHTPLPTHQPTPTPTPTTPPGCPGGMISYWKLDEGGGSTFSDSSGENNANCSGGACPALIDGVIAKARQFDGTDDRLIVSSHPSLNWGNPDSFTVMAWVKMTGSCTGNKIFVGKPNDLNDLASWWFGCSSQGNTGAFYLRDSNGNNAIVRTERSINDGRWHHLAAVRDAASSELRVYLDGVLEADESAVYTGHFVTSHSLTIGSFGNEYHAPVSLDEIAVYRSAVPVESLRSQYFLTLPYCGMCSSPIRIMPLGDSITLGSGDPIKDGYRRFLYDSLSAHTYWIDMVGSLAAGSPDFDRDHEGHGGYHAAGLPGRSILPMVYEWLVGSPADVVLLHIGTNDINDGGESAEEVSQILDEIYRYDEQITVVLARIINRQVYNPATTQYNLDLQEMADARIANGDKLFVVDMEPALTYPEDMIDLLHPNISGYSKMGPVWEPPLISLLPICSVP